MTLKKHDRNWFALKPRASRYYTYSCITHNLSISRRRHDRMYNNDKRLCPCLIHKADIKYGEECNCAIIGTPMKKYILK